MLKWHQWIQIVTNKVFSEHNICQGNSPCPIMKSLLVWLAPFSQLGSMASWGLRNTRIATVRAKELQPWLIGPHHTLSVLQGPIRDVKDPDEMFGVIMFAVLVLTGGVCSHIHWKLKLTHCIYVYCVIIFIRIWFKPVSLV